MKTLALCFLCSLLGGAATIFGLQFLAFIAGVSLATEGARTALLFLGVMGAVGTGIVLSQDPRVSR